ncbi:MARVEL domain-containing protein 1 isoform X2 [Hydra vulgaris]|nr:MARVEL domain-containing protein 1 [Hydra vulgaris]
MSDAPTNSSGSNIGFKVDLKPDFGFLRSPAGILTCVNIILLFLAWVIMAGWKDNTLWSPWIISQVSYFLFMTVTTWLVLSIFLVLFILKIHTKILINWPLTLCIFCMTTSILLIISSIVSANEARKWRIYANGGVNGLAAAAAFGFFASFGLAIQAMFNFKEYRNPV